MMNIRNLITKCARLGCHSFTGHQCVGRLWFLLGGISGPASINYSFYMLKNDSLASLAKGCCWQKLYKSLWQNAIELTAWVYNRHIFDTLLHLAGFVHCVCPVHHILKTSGCAKPHKWGNHSRGVHFAMGRQHDMRHAQHQSTTNTWL